MGASAARSFRPGVRLSRAAPKVADERPRAMIKVVNYILIERWLVWLVLLMLGLWMVRCLLVKRSLEMELTVTYTQR
jgi:hypothetical protein